MSSNLLMRDAQPTGLETLAWWRNNKRTAKTTQKQAGDLQGSSSPRPNLASDEKRLKERLNA
jgi:hypothetical protein